MRSNVLCKTETIDLSACILNISCKCFCLLQDIEPVQTCKKFESLAVILEIFVTTEVFNSTPSHNILSLFRLVSGSVDFGIMQSGVVVSSRLW